MKVKNNTKGQEFAEPVRPNSPLAHMDKIRKEIYSKREKTDLEMEFLRTIQQCLYWASGEDVMSPHDYFKKFHRGK